MADNDDIIIGGMDASMTDNMINNLTQELTGDITFNSSINNPNLPGSFNPTVPFFGPNPGENNVQFMTEVAEVLLSDLISKEPQLQPQPQPPITSPVSSPISLSISPITTSEFSPSPPPSPLLFKYDLTPLVTAFNNLVTNIIEFYNLIVELIKACPPPIISPALLIGQHILKFDNILENNIFITNDMAVIYRIMDVFHDKAIKLYSYVEQPPFSLIECMKTPHELHLNVASNIIS